MQRIKGKPRFTYTDASGAKIEEDDDDDEVYQEDFSSDDEEEGAGEKKKHHSSARDQPQSSGDPLVDLISNPEVIRISSTLIAKLERVRYDDMRKGVFKTPWGANLFKTACKRLGMKGFNIDNWYFSIVGASSEALGDAAPDIRINPVLNAKTIETNWLLELFRLEQTAPGFMKVLHNLLKLEDDAQKKLGQGAKEEANYDWYMEGPRNPALYGGKLLLEGGTKKDPRLLLTSSCGKSKAPDGSESGSPGYKK